jgi:hypothetical protein
MTSAQTRVLVTPELLEAILLQLRPLSDLLLAQLVSSNWQNAITSSPLLQQSLFLRAAPRPLQQWTANPLLRQHFLPWFVVPTARYTFSMPTYDSLQTMDWMHQTPIRDAFLRQEASWRNMVFVQPPPRELNLVRIAEGQGGDYEEKTVFTMEEGAEGVTMGMLYDITESFLRSESVSSFGLTITNTEGEGQAPRMTLWLMYTQQCCVDLPHQDSYMKSRGSKWDIDGVEWMESRLEEEVGIDMDRETDLTAEKGGVDGVMWGEWQREREGVLEIVSEKLTRKREARERKAERRGLEGWAID